jgi:UDP-GlcNAc:undecaprenyl-phosphate GlcNAc-1-phosphate transferase
VVLYCIFIFFGCTVLSLLLTRFVRNWAFRHGWLDQPSADRHLHIRPVPRIGGIALILSFAGGITLALVAPGFLGERAVLPSQIVRSIFLPVLLVFFLGLYDDLRGLGPYWKFGIETVAASWLYVGGIGIHRLDFYSAHGPLRISLGLPLTIFWVLLVTNAFNLIDGLDGLAAGSALFSTIIMFLASLWQHVPLVSVLSIVLAGSILGFLRYNFHPATIFLGDSGSLVIGFLLSALALAGSQKATTILAVAIPVVSFGLPILDVTLAVVRRFINSKPLFQGDNDHIHHKLLKRGLSHRNAVLVLYAVAAAFGLLSLMMLHGEVMLGFVLVVIGLGVWWGVQELKYLEFYELVAIARRLRQRRRIMTNNLRLRRATESLRNTASSFSQICRILELSLEPLGFCGAAFRLLTTTRNTMNHTPLRTDQEGRLLYLWKRQNHAPLGWELKLELVSRSGSKLGDFFVVRTNVSEPLWVDINLIHNELCSAVSEAVGRAVELASMLPAAQSHSRSILSARAAAASSKLD